MKLADIYIGQLKSIVDANRRIIERVPEESLTWKPHEKSMTLGRLAMHIAELPQFVTRCLTTDFYDFAVHPYVANIPETRQQILDTLEAAIQSATATLSNATDEDLAKNWSLRRGDITIYDLPRTAILHREQQHIVHHRGQLSVYLRLLDVPVPGIFGPSADER